MNCVMCRQPTVTPFSTLQKFIVCVCLQEHYQCMKCDVRQKYQCGLCGRITFVIHVDLRFANNDLSVSEMEAHSLDRLSNDGSNDEDSEPKTLWESGDENTLVAMESGRTQALDSDRNSISLPRRRSGSLECTQDTHPGCGEENAARKKKVSPEEISQQTAKEKFANLEKHNKPKFTAQSHNEVEATKEEEIDDDILFCCQFKRSTPIPEVFRSESFSSCMSTMSTYAAEEKSLLMSGPYSVRDPIEMESNKDIRLYTKEERLARIDYMNREYKYSSLQEKYFRFGCQFLTKRRHMEWLTSEPKCKPPHHGMPLVRRVLYPRPCLTSREPRSELIELLDDFNENILFKFPLPFPFHSLEMSQFLANCPQPNCQEALYKYNITFHLTRHHNAWLVAYLPLEKPFSFELDLKDTQWNVKCHAVIQLQDVLCEYSKRGVELSLTIMSMHVQLSEILQACQSDQRITFIWAATTIANCFPLKVNLTLWSKKGNSAGSTISYTGSPYDIKGSIRPYDLIKSGRVIMLTANQVDAFTKKGKKKMGIQFVAMMAPCKKC